MTDFIYDQTMDEIMVDFKEVKSLSSLFYIH